MGGSPRNRSRAYDDGSLGVFVQHLDPQLSLFWIETSCSREHRTRRRGAGLPWHMSTWMLFSSKEQWRAHD